MTIFCVLLDFCVFNSDGPQDLLQSTARTHSRSRRRRDTCNRSGPWPVGGVRSSTAPGRISLSAGKTDFGDFSVNTIKAVVCGLRTSNNVSTVRHLESAAANPIKIAEQFIPDKPLRRIRCASV